MNVPFKVVIAYEDFEHGIRAREMIERVLSQLPTPLKLDTAAWNFHWLGHAEVRNRATAEALDADMVVLSAQSAGDLPSGVKEWLNAWLPRKQDKAAAFVALVEKEDEQNGPSVLRTQLLEMAAQASVDFFWRTPTGQGAGHGHRLSHSSRNPGSMPAAENRPVGQSSPRCWGINE